MPMPNFDTKEQQHNGSLHRWKKMLPVAMTEGILSIMAMATATVAATADDDDEVDSQRCSSSGARFRCRLHVFEMERKELKE